MSIIEIVLNVRVEEKELIYEICIYKFISGLEFVFLFFVELEGKLSY